MFGGKAGIEKFASYDPIFVFVLEKGSDTYTNMITVFIFR